MINIPSESILAQLPGTIIWKDLESKFLGANHSMATIIGYKSMDEVIGLTDHDMKCPAVGSAEHFRQQDQEVIKTEKQIQLLDIHTYANDEIKIFITTKKPLYDSQGKIAGTVAYLSEIDDSTLTKITVNLMRLGHNQKKMQQYNPDSKVLESNGLSNLTEKETEVLYYMLQGKSAREIGEIMFRSQRTIESHIDAIKMKTGCTNKSDVIMYAINSGFLSTIPRSLIPRELNLSIQLHERNWDTLLRSAL